MHSLLWGFGWHVGEQAAHWLGLGMALVAAAVIVLAVLARRRP